jgi:hypothetical protein
LKSPIAAILDGGLVLHDLPGFREERGEHDQVVGHIEVTLTAADTARSASITPLCPSATETARGISTLMGRTLVTPSSSGSTTAKALAASLGVPGGGSGFFAVGFAMGNVVAL